MLKTVALILSIIALTIAIEVYCKNKEAIDTNMDSVFGELPADAEPEWDIFTNEYVLEGVSTVNPVPKTMSELYGNDYSWGDADTLMWYHTFETETVFLEWWANVEAPMDIPLKYKEDVFYNDVVYQEKPRAIKE